MARLYSIASSVGRKPLRIFSPSRGKTGTRLKMAREIFIIIMSGIILAIRLPAPRKPATIERRVARMMLLAGPASAIKAVSRLGFLKLYGSNSTGLPQPKPTIRIKRVPRGSRWARGSRVTRPLARGVGSPRVSATLA